MPLAGFSSLHILVCFIMSHTCWPCQHIFCERLNFNTFMRTFIHFTIVVLTFYDFTSYFILLPISISARVFMLCSFIVGVLFMTILESPKHVLE